MHIDQNESTEIISSSSENNFFETIGEKFATLQQFPELAAQFLSSEELQNTVDTIKTIGDEISEISKAINFFKKFSNIPNALFLHKMELYCKGLTSIPKEKMEKYIKKIGKTKFNKDSVFILTILNQVEELSKISIFISIFEEYANEEIDETTYRRLMIQVNHTLFSDLLYIKENITEKAIQIKNEAEQNLLAKGWLYYDGQAIGEINEGSHVIGLGKPLYYYTTTAHTLANIMKSPDAESTSY